MLFKESEGFHLAINCSENFPKERFNAEIKSENALHLESNPTYTTRKSENEEKSDELKVEFAQTTKITPQLLIIVHAIIRIVTELDNIGSLEAKRKQEIEYKLNSFQNFIDFVFFFLRNIKLQIFFIMFFSICHITTSHKQHA